MAQRYNKRHAVHIFDVGDMVSVGIPREDRAKTDNKRLYAKVIAKPQPERHQLLTKYGVLVNLYPTKDLQPATDLMSLEIDIPDTPQARETTLTLANAAHQASTTTRVSVSCTCKKSCSNRRCRCFKNDFKCSIYCHTKVSNDHDCGNLSVLAERTQIGLKDMQIDPELLDE